MPRDGAASKSTKDGIDSKVVAIEYNDRYLFTPLSVALLLEVVLGLRGSVGQDRWANPRCRITTTRPIGESRVFGTLYAYWPDSNVRDKVLESAFEYFGMEAKTEVLDIRDVKHARILEVVFSDGWSLVVRFDKGVSYWRVPGRSAGRRVNVSFDFGDGGAEELASQVKRVAELSVPVEGDIYPTEIFVKAQSGNARRA